jgi:MerR family transcriptional regulator, light-induced transcriptional regulator
LLQLLNFIKTYMELFTISDIENLSGIKAHTLRIWELRYNILRPKRRESKHRYYDNEDLRQILQIAHLNRTGFKISKIAKMTTEQMRTLALDKGIEDTLYENFVTQLVQACNDFDEERFNKIYHTIFLHIGFEKVVIHIFYPLLQRIGVYWMTESVRPAQEHFASHQIIKKMLVGIQALESPQGGSITALFNPTGEHHEIPVLFIQYLLKRSGKRSRYFGADVQLSTVEQYMKQQQVSRLHIHVITNFSNLTMDELAEQMLNRFPMLEIVISGPKSANVTTKNKRLTLLTSLESLVHFCNGKDVI